MHAIHFWDECSSFQGLDFDHLETCHQRYHQAENSMFFDMPTLLPSGTALEGGLRLAL